MKRAAFIILMLLGITSTVVGLSEEYTACKTQQVKTSPTRPTPKVSVVLCASLVCEWGRAGVREHTGIEIQWLERAGRRDAGSPPPPTSQEFSVSINGKLWVMQRFQGYTYVHDPLLNRGQFYDSGGSPAFVVKG